MIITASGMQFRANPDATVSTDSSATNGNSDVGDDTTFKMNDNDMNNNGIDTATAKIDKGMYVCMFVSVFLSSI